MAARRASGPRGRRARTRRCATAGGACGAHGRPSRLGGEPLAALVAAALEHVPAGARAHARTEPVGAGALALLGLVGALHREEPRVQVSRRGGLPISLSIGAGRAAGRFSRDLREPPPEARSRPLRRGVHSAAPRAAAAVSPRGPPRHTSCRPGPEEGRDCPVPEQLDQIWDASATSSARETRTSSSTSGSSRSSSPAVSGETLYVRAPDHIRTWVGERYLPLLARGRAARLRRATRRRDRRRRTGERRGRRAPAPAAVAERAATALASTPSTPSSSS